MGWNGASGWVDMGVSGMFGIPQCKQLIFLSFFLFLCLRQGFIIAQASLKLTVELRITLNSSPSCIHLPSARIPGMPTTLMQLLCLLGNLERMEAEQLQHL